MNNQDNSTIDKKGWKFNQKKPNLIVGTSENPTKFTSGETIINKKSTKKNLEKLIEINNDVNPDVSNGKTTTDAKAGGLLKGKPHYDNAGNPTGGIPGVVDGQKPIETEGEEFVVNAEASKKHWKELSKINQQDGNGVPIGPPISDYDDDPTEEFENGGKIQFNPNYLPSKWIMSYAKKIKSKHPEIWKLGGNIFGNEAFENLKRVSERGYWLDSEEWMYIKWRSYVARHKQDFRIEGVVAMLKWVDKVDKGWAYMKELIEEEIKKRKPVSKKMDNGGNVNNETLKVSKYILERHPKKGDVFIGGKVNGYKIVKIKKLKKHYGIIYEILLLDTKANDNGDFNRRIVGYTPETKKISDFSQSFLTSTKGKYYTRWSDSDLDEKFKTGGNTSILKLTKKVIQDNALNNGWYLETIGGGGSKPISTIYDINGKEIKMSTNYDVKEKWISYFEEININPIRQGSRHSYQLIYKKMSEGGGVDTGAEKFIKWYIDWFKGVSDKMNIYFSLPNSIAPFKEKNVVIMDLFEKIDQGIDAKKYLKEIIKQADEYYVTIYLEPTPRYKYFLNNVAKREKISKEYLISYYEKFGFDLTSNKKYMKRLPNNPVVKYATGGSTKNYVTYKYRYNRKYNYPKNTSHSLEQISKDSGVSMKGLQQIYDKGIGAYKTNPASVRPNVKSKEQWAMARVYSAVMGGKAAKVDKNELKMSEGGAVGEEITCQNCGWDWNTNQSEEFDKYVCHNCGTDNSKFYAYKKYEKGGLNNCIDFIKNSEAIKNNGYYLEFKNLSIYVGTGDKVIPKIKSIFLITYNSGGQKNLNSIDTINSMELANKLANLLNVEIGVARIIVSEQVNHSKRFEINQVNSIGNKNIIVADRDTIVCTNLSMKLFDGGGNVNNSSKISSASSRFRPSETIVFDPPLVGINGNKLISYTWKYEWTTDFSITTGDVIEKRVSDWTQAEISADTGRNIVHSFTIMKPDGTIQSVSSESVLVLMGFVTKEQKKEFANLATASKTLAKQQMQMSILEAQQKEYEEIKKSIIDAGYPEISIAPSRFEDNVTLIMGSGTVQADSNNPFEKERIERLQNSYVRGEMQELGINPFSISSYQIQELKKRIDRQKRKVENIIATEKMSTGGNLEFDIDKLLGKYVNVHLMGVSEPEYFKIKEVRVTPENFRYRDVFIKGDVGQTKFPLEKLDDFITGKEILIEDIDGEYAISLGKNQLAKGGLIASNGKESNLTPEQYKLVRTPAFKAWFGDWENNPVNSSKVVDENGEPLVVFHGSHSKENFSVFEYRGDSYGFHFGTKQSAKDRLRDLSAEMFYGGNPRILEVFLSIKNPIKLKDYNKEEYETAEELGKDGVIYKNEVEDAGSISYAVFSSNQIKLADGTNKKFDGNNPDIRFDTGGNVDKQDTVTMDIPLLIRTLELVREDIHSDPDLHFVVENLLHIKNKKVLTMDDYAYIADIENKHTKQYASGGNTSDGKKQVSLGFGSLGSGTTVWDRNRIQNADYKIVAHISDSGKITYYDKNLPESAINQIEQFVNEESKLYAKGGEISEGYDFTPIQTPLN